MAVRATVQGMAQRANPAFTVGAVVVALAAFAVGATVASVEIHTYVHVMAGVLWTVIDVFMALVVGPVLGSLDAHPRAGWFQRFTPKMAFLMPTLATVTIFGGITLAVRIGVFPNTGVWIVLFVLVTFSTAALVLGWVFDAFDDRRRQVFVSDVVLVNGAYLVSEFAAAVMAVP